VRDQEWSVSRDRHLHSNWLIAGLLVFVAGCATAPVVERRVPGEPASAPLPAPLPAARPTPAKQPSYILKRGGGFYQDDGPGDNPPADIDAIPDAVPRVEPPHKFANNPYSVLGRAYVPLHDATAFRERGVASWYGRKFHGQKTASGESYDMFGMTAAHPTLPIPCYVRVSNPATGKSVVVRINDRGPFHNGRIIDLSYSAAWKLGLVGGGSGLVEVAGIVPGADLPPLAGRSPDSGTVNDEDIISRIAAKPEPTLPEITDSRGIWLQLGAFGNRDNAESLRQRLAGQLASLGGKLVVRAEGSVHRVQIGPYREADEAHRVAMQISDALAMKPLVIQR
jgi:rare lipoprotein A